MPREKSGGRLGPGDVCEVLCGNSVAFISYLGKHPRLGDAIWVVPASLGADPQDVCRVFVHPGYVAFYPATAALRRGLIRRVGYCTEGMRLLPTATRHIAAEHADGTVARWFVQDGETRHVLEALTAEARALPVAELWNHEELVARLRGRWTPAQYESPAP